MGKSLKTLTIGLLTSTNMLDEAAILRVEEMGTLLFEDTD